MRFRERRTRRKIAAGRVRRVIHQSRERDRTKASRASLKPVPTREPSLRLRRVEHERSSFVRRLGQSPERRLRVCCDLYSEPNRVASRSETVRALAVPLAADAADDEADALAINRSMEAVIRQRPAQYLWGYHRYKAPRKAA